MWLKVLTKPESFSCSFTIHPRSPCLWLATNYEGCTQVYNYVQLLFLNQTVVLCHLLFLAAAPWARLAKLSAGTEPPWDLAVELWIRDAACWVIGVLLPPPPPPPPPLFPPLGIL